MKIRNKALGVIAASIVSINANAAPIDLREIVDRTESVYGGRHAIVDGLYDAFDGAYYLSGYGGLSVERNITTLQDTRTYRIFDTFTNNTGVNFSGTLQYYTNLGSDGRETTPATTNYSHVTDDLYFGYDPAIAFVFGNNDYASNNVSVNAQLGSVNFLFDFDLAVGQSLSLMNFASLYADDSDRSIDFAQAQARAASLVAAPDYRGLTESQVASVLNFDGQPTTEVSEPTTFALFGLGLVALGAVRRKS